MPTLYLYLSNFFIRKFLKSFFVSPYRKKDMENTAGNANRGHVYIGPHHRAASAWLGGKSDVGSNPSSATSSQVSFSDLFAKTGIVLP